MWFKSAMAGPWDLPARVPVPERRLSVPCERELLAAWDEQTRDLEVLLRRVSVGRPHMPTVPDVRWAMRAESFDGAAAAISDAIPNLWATSSALRGLDEGALARELQNEDWWLQHEVVVRRAWIDFHRELLEAGKAVGYPFRSWVAGRGTRSRGRDREFFTLILLGHWMSACEGRRLLLSRVGETPDFVCCEAGAEIGVEATEATPEARARNQTLEDRFVTRLNAVARELGALVTVECRGDLGQFLDQVDTIEASLRNELVRRDGPRRVSCATGAVKCSIEIEPSASPAVLVSDPRGTTGAEIALDNEAALATLHSAVDRKLAGPQPGRPCLLAIYPNFLSEANLREVLDLAEQRWTRDVSSHFDEIWVVQEQAAARIC
jgi:hypothetical protein